MDTGWLWTCDLSQPPECWDYRPVPLCLPPLWIYTYIVNFFFFDRISCGSDWSQTCWQRMIPNPWSSCLYLPSIRIIGIATTSFWCSAGDGTTPPGLPHTHFWELLSEWDTENGSSGKLAVLSVSTLPLQVTKLVFQEDGKMNLIKFPFDKQISMPIGNKVDNSRMKT